MNKLVDVESNKPYVCPKCDGLKKVEGKLCPTCEGTGVIFKAQSNPKVGDSFQKAS